MMLESIACVHNRWTGLVQFSTISSEQSHQHIDDCKNICADKPDVQKELVLSHCHDKCGPTIPTAYWTDECSPSTEAAKPEVIRAVRDGAKMPSADTYDDIRGKQKDHGAEGVRVIAHNDCFPRSGCKADMLGCRVQPAASFRQASNQHRVLRTVR